MHRRTLAVIAAIALTTAACGQKAGVHSDTVALANNAGTDAAGEVVAGDSTAPLDAGGDTAGAVDTGTGTGTGSATPGAARPGVATTLKPGAPVAATGKVWGDTITIGIHAPLTGAAPLPAASFERGKDLYAKWINDKGGINGRKLAVEFLDDEYQPATAVSKCKQLVEQKKAFMLFGGGGTDQIQACAKYAQNVKVPYLSAGVTEVGLRSLRYYFAASMSYPQQAPMLANYIKQNFAGQKVGMVYANTKNFFDARDAFLKANPSTVLYQVARSPSQSELAQTAQKICSDQTKVAFPLMAPSNYIALANQVKGQCGLIQWVGVGVTQGLNAVASTGCQTNQAIDKGIFFSPSPGEDKAASLDPDFKAAVDKYNNGSFDDIFVLLWGGVKFAAKMIEAAGKNLTQAGFVQAAEQTKVAASMFPPVSYSPSDHFGGRQMHVLQLDCAGNNNKYKTIATNASY